jgi:hypothetical protein
MKSTALISIVALCCAAPYAIAQCEIGRSITYRGLSQKDVARRDEIYVEMCNRVGGDLADGDDEDLRKRLVLPKRLKPSNSNMSEEFWNELGKGKRSVFLATIAEQTGAVSWVYVLKSSGSQRVDEAAAALFRNNRFATPFTLDGKPARTFHVFVQSFGQ